MIQSFRELTVWKKSFALARDVYLLTNELPADERFGLTSQMRRCAVSITSNIAEGQQRNNRLEYRQFLGIAKGSSAELETQLLLAGELYNIDNTKVLGNLDEVQRMLQTLLSKFKSPQATSNLAPLTSNLIQSGEE